MSEIWQVLDSLGLWVFLASIVFLGMPHGAVDHLLYFRSIGLVRIPVGKLIGFVGVYLGIVLVGLAIWIVLPEWSAVAFLGLTAWHWGRGDALFEKRSGLVPDRLFWLRRGLLPMLGPLVVHADLASAALLEGVVLSPFSQVKGVSDLPQNWNFWISSVSGAVLLSAMLSRRWTTSLPDRRWLREDVLLLGGFLLLPPLLSIGLFFIGWHSLRYLVVARSILVCKSNGLKKRGGWLRLGLHTLPFSLGGVLVLLFVALYVSDGWTRPESMLGSYVILLWSLTWPHAIVHQKVEKFLVKNRDLV